jgi:hypothetical protein
MQYAYLLTMIVFYIYWLISIISKYIEHYNFIKTKINLLKYFRLAHSITKIFIKSTLVSNQSVFSSSIFISWPFLITNKNAISKKSDQIKLELMVYNNKIF